MPEFLAAEIGKRALERVMMRSGLPYAVLENRDIYIPQTMLTSFLRNSAREAGEEMFGLRVSPYLTVSDYGSWGEYVLSAPTLRASLFRIKRAMQLHSNDKISIVPTSAGVMQFIYDFAARKEQGYDHISACAIGVINSIFRKYAGSGWRPVEIDLDISKPKSDMEFEDVFDCPVRFNEGSLAVRFSARDIHISAPTSTGRLISLGDVRRDRLGGAPKNDTQKVWFLAMLQLLEGPPDLDKAAKCLGISMRGLQRRLASEGTTFREVANHAIAHKSKELLNERDLTITDIALDLGYSTPAHFARAFHKQTGLSPGQFRSRSSVAS
jgi:AraC-like DNA-binding protein